MPEAKVTMQVRRVNDTISVIDIQGELTAFAEQTLMNAYSAACGPHTNAILLNFSQMEYMNSSGIGLIVTLLIRVNRQKQRLVAFGLSEHYQHIFQLTRLNDAINICAGEADAILAASVPPVNPNSRPSFFKRR
ncbi:MAG TPA: STAS domain-containing protein [Ktedonobacteraceae bacterium]|nr:STAS domain-containing protein [Ktedonobacteraceae bacterium]